MKNIVSDVIIGGKHKLSWFRFKKYEVQIGQCYRITKQKIKDLC